MKEKWVENKKSRQVKRDQLLRIQWLATVSLSSCNLIALLY